MAGLSERAKIGYQKFCDGTSMHGFTELYYTKSRCWFLVWFAAIGTAIGLTTYQVFKAVDNFMDQATSTSIQLAKSEDMMFPPLQICHPHWMAWVDWRKASQMNFTRDAVLYGLSYMSTVYSASRFDIDRAKSDFMGGLRRNKLETVDNFYRAIAFQSETAIKADGPFDSTEFRSDENIKLCVTLNETSIRSILNSSTNGRKTGKSARSNVVYFTVDYSKVGPVGFEDLNNSEVSQYILDWLLYEAWELKYDEQNISWAVLPMIVYPNKFDSNGIYISTTSDIYWVSMQLSIQKWKSKPDSSCRPGTRWISTNNSCETKCLSDKYFSLGFDRDFHDAIISEKTKPEDIAMKKDIVFLTDGVVDAPPRNNDINDTAVNYILSTIMDERKTCEDSCSRLIGCEVYNFDYTVNAKVLYDFVNAVRDTNSKVRIVIQYPAESDVLVMAEQDAQTWEGFVGNVGGLLGIWTGASVLSFLQLIYLCCFTESECGWPFEFSKTRSLDAKPTILVKAKGRIELTK